MFVLTTAQGQGPHGKPSFNLSNAYCKIVWWWLLTMITIKTKNCSKSCCCIFDNCWRAKLYNRSWTCLQRGRLWGGGVSSQFPDRYQQQMLQMLRGTLNLASSLVCVHVRTLLRLTGTEEDEVFSLHAQVWFLDPTLQWSLVILVSLYDVLLNLYFKFPHSSDVWQMVVKLQSQKKA